MRIGDTNTASIQLFRSMGYEQTGHSDVFRETTLQLAVTQERLAALQARLAHVVEGQYERPSH